MERAARRSSRSGFAYAYRDRDSTLRLFRFAYSPSGIPLDPTLPFNQLYDKPNIGGGPPFPIVFDETTQPQNPFGAHETTSPAIVMFELPIIRDRCA